MPQADLSQQGKLELVLDLKGELLEGPLWDARTKRLLFIDINKQHIHIYDPQAKSESRSAAPNPAAHVHHAEA